MTSLFFLFLLLAGLLLAGLGRLFDEELALALSVNEDDEPARIARVPAMRTTCLTIEKREEEKRLRLREERNDCDGRRTKRETTTTICEVR